MSGSMVTLVAAQAIMLSSSATIMRLGARVRYWQGHAGHMQESGYLVPPPTVTARAVWRVVTRLIVYLKVGPVKVTGRQNLRVDGRKIFVANHQYELDFAMVAVGTNSACPNTMTSCGVLKHRNAALFAAWTGSIPVNVKEVRGGKKAFDASVKALLRKRDAEFLIFPQGGLFDEIELEDFKPGAARMQEAAYRLSDGEPVSLIPVYIEYARNPQHKPFSHFFLGKFRRMYGKVNFGGRISIAEPIAYCPSRGVETTTGLIYGRLMRMQAEANRTAKFRQG